MGMMLGLSVSITGYGGTSANSAPVIDLNGASGGINASGTFTEGDGATTFLTSATVTDANTNPLATLTIVGSGIQDGASEVLVIGGTSFPLNANSSTTGTAGGTTFAIAYTTATQTFSITNNASSTMPLADVQTLLRGITYNDSAVSPTVGERTFTFTCSDGTDDSTEAILLITVQLTAANNAPVVDLNGGGGGITGSGSFTEGDAFTSYLTSATLTDADSDPIASLVMTCSGQFGDDGLDEQIKFDTWVTDAATDKTETLVVGSTTFSLAFVSSTGILTVTKSGGGTFPAADGQALIRLFQYGNAAEPPTEGDRTFSWVANDGTDNSTAAVLTVTVAAAGSTVLSLGGTSGNYAGQFIVGGTAAAVSDNASVAGDDPTSMTITLGGFGDGDDEEVTIGATSYPAATDDTGSATAGATTFDVAFASGVFTITKNGGGAMPAADLQTLIDGITVEDTAWPMTTGARTLAFSLDGGGAKTATITHYIAELPRAYVDTTYSLPVGGTTHTPANAAALQTAFDDAVGGDVIVLAAGTTYSGNFTLAPHTGTDPIYIISDDLASLTAGTRVTPLDAASMPKLSSPDELNPALTIEKGVDNLRFAGIEITTAYASQGGVQYGLVRVGYQGASSNRADNIIFDRCYIHGTRTGNIRDGVVVYDVTNFALIDSWVSECHGVGYEAHAVHLYVPLGPTKIFNNYIEAGGMNLFVGDNSVSTVPADIEIRNNHLHKPLSWFASHSTYDGIDWLVKNLLEVKAGSRILIDGNTLENVWPDSQTGEVFVITPRGGLVEDLTITNNHCREFKNGLTINDTDVTLRRVDLRNNLWDDTTSVTTTGEWLAMAGNNADNSHWRILHNTVISQSLNALVTFNGNLSTPNMIKSLEFRDNLGDHGTYGIFGNSKGSGYVPTEFYVEDFSFDGNALIWNGSTASYPDNPGFTGFMWPTTRAAVGFVDDTFDDIAAYALDAGSTYLGAATDGTDPGCDIDALTTALGAYSYDANISAPTIELGGDGVEDYAADYYSGALDVAPDAVVWDYADRSMTTLTIVVSGVVDGGNESLTIGGTAFPLNADSTTTGTANSQTFAIAYTTSTQTFVITLDGGGIPKLSSIEALIQGISYANSSPTTGARTITCTTSDGTHTGNSAVSTVTVLADDTIASYLRKVPIVISQSKIDADLTDFTVYVTRAMFPVGANEIFDPSSGDRAQADGGDIRFSTDSSGSTLIPCDVIAFELDSSTGAADAVVTISVKIPSILAASDTTIYMWYSTAGTTSQPAADNPHGADNAYDDNFLGFWPDGGTTDRTSNSMDLTATGSPTIGGATGPQGLAATDLNGSSQYLSVATTAFDAYPVTMICWVSPDVNTTGMTVMCLGQAAQATPNLRAYMRLAGDVAGDYARASEYNSGEEYAPSTVGFTASTWQQIAGSFVTTGEKYCYLNGGNKGSVVSAFATSGNPTDFGVGAIMRATPSQYFNGKIALVELHAVTRSDAWIRANYEMIADPAAFAVAGTPGAA